MVREVTKSFLYTFSVSFSVLVFILIVITDSIHSTVQSSHQLPVLLAPSANFTALHHPTSSSQQEQHCMLWELV